MRLLFLCAHWHGLAKLRMHSDPTLEILDSVTTTLGEAFRHFQRKICPKYHTRELNREVATRRRRQSKKADGSSAADLPNHEPRKREFNIQTYKHHSLGDYAKTIRRFGTTDSYSSTVVRVLACLYFFFADESLYRESLNIVLQKRGTCAQTANNLSNS
jgi:hypothetical protein